jgi:hypothetical protein
MSWSALPGIADAQGRCDQASYRPRLPHQVAIQIRVGDLVACQMPMHKFDTEQHRGRNAR